MILGDASTLQSSIRSLLTASLSAILLAPLVVHAAEPMDMKGRWVGRTHTIVAGQGAHWPSNKGTFEKPGLFEKDIVLEIKGQQDRRFWGESILSGGAERTVEPFIGELAGTDSKKVLIADTHGFFWGEVEGDTLSYCYAHAAVKAQAVMSCTAVKRSR